MSKSTRVATELLRHIQRRMAALPACLLPAEMFSTFDYTVTRNNLTHPRLWGVVLHAASAVRGVATVDVDVRLNRGGGIKFQPDLVLRNPAGAAVLYVDLESPNSSDARIAVKDVDAWVAFHASDASPPPYLILTVLPDAPRTFEQWPLRWTHGRQWNAAHAVHANRIRSSPFRYWFRHLARQRPSLPSRVIVANFAHDGRRATVRGVDPSAV